MCVPLNLELFVADSIYFACIWLNSVVFVHKMYSIRWANKTLNINHLLSTVSDANEWVCNPFFIFNAFACICISKNRPLFLAILQFSVLNGFSVPFSFVALQMNLNLFSLDSVATHFEYSFLEYQNRSTLMI